MPSSANADHLKCSSYDFSFHREVRLRFKLATWLGVARTTDGGIPPGCPLNMVFIVALHALWCRHLESLTGIQCCHPQLYADNLKCNSNDVDTLLAAAQFTVSCVKVVGQNASPSQRDLLGTAKDARKRIAAWRHENPGCSWAVKLDVRDLGGHLDVTQCALSGTLISRVKHVCHFSWSPPTSARDSVFQIPAFWTPWM